MRAGNDAGEASDRLAEFLREVDDRAPHRAVADLGEGADQPHRLRLGEHLEQVRVARLLECVAALEEGADMGAKDRGDLVEPAAPHPVGAVLVFLHLLEAHPELLAELGLRHLLRKAMDTDIAADHLVDLLRSLLQHCGTPRSGPAPLRPPALTDICAGPPPTPRA